MGFKVKGKGGLKIANWPVENRAGLWKAVFRGGGERLGNTYRERVSGSIVSPGIDVHQKDESVENSRGLAGGFGVISKPLRIGHCPKLGHIAICSTWNISRFGLVSQIVPRGTSVSPQPRLRAKTELSRLVGPIAI
jgi:hypothetical protein